MTEDIPYITPDHAGIINENDPSDRVIFDSWEKNQLVSEEILLSAAEPFPAMTLLRSRMWEEKKVLFRDKLISSPVVNGCDVLGKYRFM